MYANISDSTAQGNMPEMAIVAATLKRGIQDALYVPSGREKETGILNGTSAKSCVVQEAMAWLMSDSKETWSCLWCCEILDLDIREIRHQVSSHPAALHRNLKWSKA